MFNAGLTQGELVALRQAGFRPLGPALGTCFFSFVVTDPPLLDGIRHPALTLAISQARSRAVDRLTQDARRLGAAGVVGAKPLVREFGEGKLEFSLLGTAVAHDSSTGNPFVTTLDGIEVLNLDHAGYTPVGIVVGAAVYAGISLEIQRMVDPFGPGQVGVLQTGVCDQLSRLLAQARAFAFQAVSEQAATHGGDGVVGLRIVERRLDFHPGLVEFIAAGSTIRLRWGVTPEIGFALPLTD